VSDDAASSRRYGEKESALILRRAVALQEASGRGAARGLSLEDLRQIALEVGVEPSYVTEAARGVVEERGALARFLGGPAQFQYITASAADVGDARDQAIIDEIRRFMGRHGVFRRAGDSLEWKAQDGFGGTFVTVSRVDGETRVRVIGVRTEAAIALFSLAGTAGLITAAILLKKTGLGDGPLAIPTLVTTALATWAGARAIWSRISSGWTRRLRATAEAIGSLLGHPGPDRLPARAGADFPVGESEPGD